MADASQACCERAKNAYVARLRKTVVAYPVIKSIPCPDCRRIVKIRMYAPEVPQHSGA